MVIPSPASGTLRQYKIASLLLLLAPLSGAFGLWLIFPALRITGNACLSCSPTIAFATVTSASLAVQIVTGAMFLLVSVLFFVSSLGMFGSKDTVRAQRWIRWLGRLRPSMGSHRLNETPVNSIYRIYARMILLVILVEAILLIPGIGEDRQYALNQFSTLFLGPVWYLYAMAVGVSSFILISFRRPGGYILGIAVSIISLGTVLPDVLGLLPPSAPTLRTTILALSGLPLALLLVYVSWRAFHSEVPGAAALPGEGRKPRPESR